MANYKQLVETIFIETLACQDPNSAQSINRKSGRYAPLGPHIPGDRGSYPTTDAAMSALAKLADSVRENDPALKQSIGRDAMRKMTSEVFGTCLQELAREPDPAARWKAIVRPRLLNRVRASGKDLMHYVPVWLFVGQQCGPFEIGPVKFVQRTDWLEAVETRRGKAPLWMATVKTLWAGQRVRGGSVVAGLKGAWKSLRAGEISTAKTYGAYASAKRFSEPHEMFSGRTIARLIHPDQWMACALVNGFEAEESRRRGLLAVQVALDTVRVGLLRPSRGLISTAADSAPPRPVDRLNQLPNEDLAHGWRVNMPGVSGSPGLADAIVRGSHDLFVAAGKCISATSTTTITHQCPKLAERWFNAVHWFGRACVVDADFIAVVMLVIALDVLSGGLMQDGILDLIACLTGVAKSDVVLQNGTTLKKLVEASYGLRSEVAHGSVLAVHRQLDEERASLEDLAAIALDHYVVQLDAYALNGGADDRDAFVASLPAAKP